jgi:hypothetical protein
MVEILEAKVIGIGRDKDNPMAVILYFEHPLTDDEMRRLHDRLCDEYLIRRIAQ